MNKLYIKIADENPNALILAPSVFVKPQIDEFLTDVIQDQSHVICFIKTQSGKLLQVDVKVVNE